MKRFWPLFTSLFLILLFVFYLSSRVLEFFTPFLPFTNYLLGIDKPTSYLVLLGNDAEMRANGGFAGSYAKLILSSKRLEFLNPRVLEFSPEISFQDIYVPNGALVGLYVKPPEPIQQAFQHGTWELANADWEPDFPTSAKSIRWFFEKGKEINPDNLVLLNLSTIKKILAVVGSFSVPDHQATLTPDNLYLFLQGKAELNFFPGSTQKKDALTSVGGAFMKKLKSLSLIKKIQIARILYQDLLDQNLLIHSNNSAFQELLEKQKLAGVLQPEALDTFSMIETNLGANKSNAFVTRQTTHLITISSLPPLSRGGPEGGGVSPTTSIHHEATIKFVNSSTMSSPNPPFYYGGDYVTYLRLYIPAEAKNISLTRTPQANPPSVILSAAEGSHTASPSTTLPSTNYDLQSIYGLTELGFWHTTKAGNESTVKLAYDLSLPNTDTCPSENRYLKSENSTCPYSLAILKQHGLVSSPQTITISTKTFSTPLISNFFYP